MLHRGLVLVTGPTGSGQIHHAGGDGRLREQEPQRPHHHGRGPDRVRAREQEAASSTSRSGHPHAVFSSALRGAARGPGRHPRRRNARPRDHRAGVDGGRAPATSCSARCTRRAPPRPSIASSTCSPTSRTRFAQRSPKR